MKASSPEPSDRVRRILGRVPGLDPDSSVVTPLEGGITNRNYKIEADAGTFVLRIGGEGTNLLGINRQNEHAASRIAADRGVGAEVVAFLPDESALVTRFVAGVVLTPEAAARPPIIQRIVQAIRRFHEGPPFPGSFSAPETVRSYHALALEHSVVFPGSAGEALDLLDTIERAVGSPPKPVPCHNDLLAANFIDDGRVIRILDWEYAGMGDPFFDLGNFAVNHELGVEEREVLLSAYLGPVDARDRARLHLFMLLSDLRESFWGFLQSGISKLEFDFQKYALDHLGRILKNAAAPEFDAWLKEVKGS